MFRRAIFLSASLVIAIPACADESDRETIGDYAGRPVGVQRAYAAYISGILRETHPTLSAGAMQACLDELAARRETWAMRLKSAAISCAFANEAAR